MITMVLGGLWHGAAWTFVIWGAYQGAMLIIGRAIDGIGTRRGIVIPPGLNWKRLLLGVLMFQVTCYGWLIFRAESFHQIAVFTSLLVRDFGPTDNTWASLALPFLEIIAPLLVVHIFQARRRSESAVLDLNWSTRYALYGAIVLLIVLFGDFEGAQFIYFQF